MYLRHTTRRKDGKVHRYGQLVRSVRVGRKVVQQTVAHLGELDADGRARARSLARAITGDRPQADLFEAAEADDAIPVRLKRIRLERGRTFGDVWLGWTLWRALKLDEVLARLVPKGATRCRGRRWRPSSSWRAGASRRANCTSPRPGIAAPPLKTCSPCRHRWSTTIDSIGRSIACCRIRTPCSSSWSPEEIVEAMRARYGLARRIWVMDRGMTSADNLEWLRETGRRYLVGTPKSELRKWAGAIADARDWQTVRDGVEAKQCVGPDGVETLVLVRSVERREKERAMHERFARRIEERLTRRGRRVQQARRPLAVGKLERQVGRLLEQNQRAAARYVIEFVPDAPLAAGMRLEWRAPPAWDDWARWSEGCDVLRTNVTDWSPDELWRTYIQLTDAEAAFRIQKSELGIRPVWHQRADRVQAHILVCFLAYVLWKTLEQWRRRAGLGQSPRTILDELRRIQSTDVVLPTDDGRELRLRCIVRPDAAQAALLDRLGLDLPQRLRVPSTSAQTAEV